MTMGMQYNTHEVHVQIVQQQVNLLQGQGTLLRQQQKDFLPLQRSLSCELQFTCVQHPQPL